MASLKPFKYLQTFLASNRYEIAVRVNEIRLLNKLLIYLVSELLP